MKPDGKTTLMNFNQGETFLNSKPMWQTRGEKDLLLEKDIFSLFYFANCLFMIVL